MLTLIKSAMYAKDWMAFKAQKFLRDERGDVNIVSIVVLIGVAVLLAIVFKEAIGDLLETLLETITQNAEKAVGVSGSAGSAVTSE